ncbi:MAG: hypothetical protein ABSG84_16665 [Acidobacteriaceae bacterium]|jgi:hypothetical protein
MAGLQANDAEGTVRLATFDQYRGLLFSVAGREAVLGADVRGQRRAD